MDKTMREAMRQRADAAKAERLRKLKEDREAFYASKRKSKVSKEERAIQRETRKQAIAERRDVIKKELADEKAKNRAERDRLIGEARSAFKARCAELRADCITKDRTATTKAERLARNAPKYIDKQGQP